MAISNFQLKKSVGYGVDAECISGFDLSLVKDNLAEIYQGIKLKKAIAILKAKGLI